MVGQLRVDQLFGFKGEPTMLTTHSIRPALVGMACAFAFSYSVAALADDMVSLATGGYARGLRSEKLMHKIDTDGDGTISKDEWIAYQEKVFTMLDKNKTGTLDAKAFIDPSGGELVTFATGGYARGLRTEAMMHKIDTDGDGTISHDEYIAYQVKIFEMMDTSTTHKGMVGPQEMFATGGANRL
jgi:hypothetical protein